MPQVSHTAQGGLRPAPPPLTLKDSTGERPLCVDLDGTLVRTDTLWEGCLALVGKGLLWLLVPFWLLRGKAYLKKRVAREGPLDPSTLPYNQALLQELQRERAQGRTILLCTGADERVAAAVSEHLGIFDGVMASDGVVNGSAGVDLITSATVGRTFRSGKARTKRR
jgi:hypothetical protein